MPAHDRLSALIRFYFLKEQSIVFFSFFFNTDFSIRLQLRLDHITTDIYT